MIDNSFHLNNEVLLYSWWCYKINDVVFYGRYCYIVYDCIVDFTIMWFDYIISFIKYS